MYMYGFMRRDSSKSSLIAGILSFRPLQIPQVPFPPNLNRPRDTTVLESYLLSAPPSIWVIPILTIISHSHPLSESAHPNPLLPAVLIHQIPYIDSFIKSRSSWIESFLLQFQASSRSPSIVYADGQNTSCILTCLTPSPFHCVCLFSHVSARFVRSFQ